MNREELIAPNDYNIAMEVERYAKDPTKKALIWKNDRGETKEITYSQLVKNVNKIGNTLLHNGLKSGDKVIIMIPRLIDAYEAYLACLKTGLIIIPSSEMLKTKDLQYRVSHGEVSGVISYYPYVDQYKDLNV